METPIRKKENAFIREFKALLRKYGAEINLYNETLEGVIVGQSVHIDSRIYDNETKDNISLDLKDWA